MSPLLDSSPIHENYPRRDLLQLKNQALAFTKSLTIPAQGRLSSEFIRGCTEALGSTVRGAIAHDPQ